MAKKLRWETIGIVIVQFAAVLAKPNTILWRPPLLGRQCRIISRTSGSGRSDVRSYTNVQMFAGVLCWAAGRGSASGVRTAVVDATRDNTFCLVRKIVAVGSSHRNLAEWRYATLVVELLLHTLFFGRQIEV